METITYTNKDLARFFDKVNKTAGCWEWTAAKKPSGYGNFWCNGKYVNAHRFIASAFVTGQSEATNFVCHTCDNKSCVRPSHLYWGNQKTNTDDSIARDRYNPWRRGMAVCDRGHSMVDRNVNDRDGRRRCVECQWLRECRQRLSRGCLTRQSTYARLALSGYTPQTLLEEHDGRSSRSV